MEKKKKRPIFTRLSILELEAFSFSVSQGVYNNSKYPGFSYWVPLKKKKV